MMKKIMALVAAAVLLLCFAGCDSADSETATGAAAASESAEASTSASSAATEAATVDLNTDGVIEGMTYKVDSTWQETDAGTMAAYSGEIAGDLPFTISVIAIDQQLVIAAQDASNPDVPGSLIGLFGVEASALQQAEFKGESAYSFTGEVEDGYQVAGYLVMREQGPSYLMMFSCTNTSDPDAQALWTAFLDTVELPA